jgi:hypothetical protein
LGEQEKLFSLSACGGSLDLCRPWFREVNMTSEQGWVLITQGLVALFLLGLIAGLLVVK